MELELVRAKMSEIDILYSEIDELKENYKLNRISYLEYITKEKKLEEKIMKLFNP